MPAIKKHVEKANVTSALKNGVQKQTQHVADNSQEVDGINELYLRLSFLCHDLRTFQGNTVVEERLQTSIYPHHIGPPYLSEEEASAVLSMDLQTLRLAKSHGQSPISNESSAGISTATLGQFLEDEMEKLMSARRTKAADGSSADFVLCTSHDLAPILQRALDLSKQFSETRIFKDAYKRWEKGVKKACK